MKKIKARRIPPTVALFRLVTSIDVAATWRKKGGKYSTRVFEREGSGRIIDSLLLEVANLGVKVDVKEIHKEVHHNEDEGEG